MDSYFRINSEKHENGENEKPKEKDKIRINVGFTKEQHHAIMMYAAQEDIKLMAALRKIIKMGIKEATNGAV